LNLTFERLELLRTGTKRKYLPLLRQPRLNPARLIGFDFNNNGTTTDAYIVTAELIESAR
jgi:hypothetical protein